MAAPRQLGTQQLTTGALLAALALVLGLAAYYLPVIGGIMFLVTPLPVAVAHLRYGYRLGWLTTAAATTLAAMLSGPLAAVYVFSNCVVGIALAWGIERRWFASRTIVLASVVGVAATAISVAVGVLVVGRQSIQQAVDAVAVSFGATGAVIEATLGEQFAAEYAKIASLAMANVWLWFGVATALVSLLVAFTWYGVCGPIMVRLGFAVPAMRPLPPVARWHLPPVWGLGFMATYFGLAVAASRVVENSAGMLIFQLVALAVTMGFRIQGFGLIAHLFDRMRMPAGLRVIALLLVAFNAFVSPTMFMLLFWLGMTDLALDLRGFARRAPRSDLDRTGASQSPGESIDNRPKAED